MTLSSMVLSHDDSALEALTSKGLLRRAQRDLASGLGRIDTVDETKAVVTVNDLTIELVSKGPTASSCTCKAHSLCRHILLAVLLLREQHETSDEPDGVADTIDAVTFVCALTDQQLIKFAGSDWDKAIALVTDDVNPAFDHEGINITVRLTDLEASVTFIAGNDLKGAAYKGPKTRKRLLTTLAALAIRKREGLQPATHALESKTLPSVSALFIDQAQKTIERAVAAVLPSRSLLAYDLLLDLAISTRCEALPRLSAELRRLAKQAHLANERSIEFEADSFVLEASRSYALLEALRTASPDDVLGGTLRRRYQPHEPMEAWVLGVSRWRSDTGARGLSAYVYSPDHHRWFTVSDGRAAGTGGAYNVANAFRVPVWGAGTLSGLVGRRVRLPEPLVTPEGVISSKAQAGSELLEAPLTQDLLLKSSAIHRNWQAFSKDLAQRMGVGIRRRSIPIPALIAPSEFGRLGFDDMKQCYNWEVRDDVGDSLVLDIAADDDESALRLWRLGKKISSIVVEASLVNTRLSIRPVAIVQTHRKNVSIHTVDFDAWPVESGLEKALAHIRKSVSTPFDTRSVENDSVDGLLDEVAEHLAGTLSSAGVEGLPSIRRRLEATGLVTLDRALENLTTTQGVRSHLRAAYIASELKSLLALGVFARET